MGAEQSATGRGTAPASRCEVNSLRHTVRSEFIKTFSEIRVLKPSLIFEFFVLFRSKPSQCRIVFSRQTVDMQQVRFSFCQLSCLTSSKNCRKRILSKASSVLAGEATFRNAFFRQVICLSDGGTSFLATRSV